MSFLNETSATLAPDKEIRRRPEIGLHLTLVVQELVGPQHLQCRLDPIGPALLPDILEGLPQDFMEHLAVWWRLVEDLAPVG